MQREVIFEESLRDEWADDLGVTEVPLNERPLVYVGIALVLLGTLVAARVAFLNVAGGAFYKKRAEANVLQVKFLPAPRGIITDREGHALAENIPAYSLFLNLKEYFEKPELHGPTLRALRDIVGMTQEEVLQRIEETDVLRADGKMLLIADLPQEKLVELRGTTIPTLEVANGFRRVYPLGPAFASLVGYTGLPGTADLAADPDLGGQELIGRAGIEAFYDDLLRGAPGAVFRTRNARGEVFGEEERREPRVGAPLTLTIDTGFQSYFYERFMEGLAALGRTTGVGLAMNPQNGEVLALMSFPAFDNNVLGSSGRNEEKQRMLTSPLRPLFNRAVGGMYAPGSTIKPLVGVAALKEGVIDPERTIFSPGYLDVPNPYDPSRPTRFLDWRYQGDVNLASAIAQSSNVYFYTVGGGAFDVKGLGIDRLYRFWQAFRLGTATGIDVPGEAKGFLPTIDWKQKATGKPWLLGDTYNVSIGQGDLLVTPIQLLDYISAIANGGKIYRPVLNISAPRPAALADLSDSAAQIREVQKGMREAVTSPLGTAHLLAGLPFAIGAKTGSAQVRSNEEENAFFVGYAPFDDPRIAILVLIENSREGSLNAVPIAEDVLAWYYENRILHEGKTRR